MKPKNLIILLAVAVVLGLAAIWSQRSNEEEPSDMIGRLVMGELPLNDIAKIVITTPNSTSVLAKADEVWVSENDYSYPADFTRIKAAIMKVADLRVGQVVEAEPGDKPAMKMVPPTGNAEGGTRVDLQSAAGTHLGALLLGETRKRSAGGDARFGGYPDGQYVSPDEGATVYLVKDSLFEFDRGDDWLDKELVSVPGTDVTSVRISGPDREPLELAVGEGGTDLVMAGLGEKEEMDRSRTGSIKSALSYLRFESVADPALPDEALGLSQPVEFVATTKNDEIYTVQIGAKVPDSENRYARIRVDLAPAAPEAEVATDETETDEARQAAEAERARKVEARAAQEKKAAELNARLRPWTYVLAAYKTDTMLSTRDQVVKAIPEETKEKPTEQTEAATEEEVTDEP